MRLNATTVRITPAVPFVNGDVIKYEKGGAGRRKDLPSIGQSGSARYILSVPLKYVPANTNLNADYPFAGILARSCDDSWVVTKGGTVDVVGGTPSTGGSGTTTASPYSTLSKTSNPVISGVAQEGHLLGVSAPGVYANAT